MLQTCFGVHYRVAFLLAGYYQVYYLLPLLPGQRQRLRAGERRVEVQRDFVYVRVFLRIFDSILHAVRVKHVDGHVHADRRMPAVRYVLFQFCEGALAPDAVVALARSVHRDPDAVRMRAFERFLAVCGDGAAEKAQLVREIAEVIDRLVSILPESRLAAFEIDETRTQRIAVLQFFPDLVVGLCERVFVVVDRAVLATQVAFVRDEHHALQRRLPSEKLRPEPPPAQVCYLAQGHFTIIRIMATRPINTQKPLSRLRAQNQRARNQSTFAARI